MAEMTQEMQGQRLDWPKNSAMSETADLRNRLEQAYWDGTLVQELAKLRTKAEILVAQELLGTEAKQEMSLVQVRDMVQKTHIAETTKGRGWTSTPEQLARFASCFETTTAFGMQLGNAATIFFSKFAELDVREGALFPLRRDCDEEMLMRMNIPFLMDGDNRTAQFWWVKVLDVELPSDPWLLKHCEPKNADHIVLELDNTRELTTNDGAVRIRKSDLGMLVLIPVGYADLKHCAEVDSNCLIEHVRQERAIFYKDKHQKVLDQERLERDARRESVKNALQERAKVMPALEGLAERMQNLEFAELAYATNDSWGARRADFSNLWHFEFGPLRSADYTDATVEEITKMIEEAEQSVTAYQFRKALFEKVSKAARSFPVEIWDLKKEGAERETTVCRQDIAGAFRSQVRISFTPSRLYIYGKGGVVVEQLDYDGSWSDESIERTVRNCYKTNRCALARWIDRVFLQVEI